MTTLLLRQSFRFAVLCVALLAMACGATRGTATQPTLSGLRDDAPASHDPELLGRWLFAELVAPGGEAKRARDARKRLDRVGGGGMVAELARGVDDAMHGRLSSAPDHYMQAVRAARKSPDPRARFVAWFSAQQAVALRHNAPGLWKRWEGFVKEAMKAPLNMGWRARGELVEWWADEAYEEATKHIDELAAEEFGCVKHLRMAGPFGRGTSPDVYRSFPAEDPGPWPHRWKPPAGQGEAPHVLKTERYGCFVVVDEPTGSGIFYAETYLDLPADREVIVAAQGAVALFVDDHQVLNRDPRKWGVWPSFGVQLWLGKGRHRILARLQDSGTSIRVMTPDGRPLGIESSTDASPTYSLARPRTTADPNILNRYIHNGDVVDPGDDVVRFTGGYLARLEGQGDVASLMIEPLLSDTSRAAGPTLVAAADFAEADPIYDDTQVRDLIRELHERAAKKDPNLWHPRLSLALTEAAKRGATEAVAPVKKLVARFPNVPDVHQALARLYGELGWSAEYAQTVRLMLKRFPESVDVLHAAVDLFDAHGKTDEANELVERIRKLDPDSEVVFTRALARHDYDTALAELKRLGKRRPDRKDIAERISDVMVRAGNESETWKKLEAAIEQSPKDAGPRLALADARYATGKHGALRQALADAVKDGAAHSPIKEAIDLVEGMSELEPYRLDSMSVVQAYEKAGRHMPGTAARVLDYAVVWVHADGSARMLEHEIIRIQSAEAISRLSEQRQPGGLVLHMRVIKQDGRILEPEYVPGKPTMTFPHLEVGDYIETEHIVSQPGDGPYGSSYLGPHWFFREEAVAYARSEFVVISPKIKNLVVETRGNVPKPKKRDLGALELRRWRVDFSPAAPSEPNSAPITEFLPSVHVGWGISLNERLERLADSVAEVTPVDPRVARIAKSIVKGVPSSERTERALRLYRWVLANVEEGDETDGRRVIVGKHGNRWRGFITLCRALDIPVEYTIAKNKLASPPVGPISRAAQYTDPVLRLEGTRGPVWLTVHSKYSPFGYVPAELRGMPAYLLVNEPKKLEVPATGIEDGITYVGNAVLAADGSAKVRLVMKFQGKYAMALREGFSQLPERRVPDVLESQVLGRSLRGARLVDHRIENLDDLDVPLLIHMTADIPSFAQLNAGVLTLSPPFSPKVSQLAALPKRQTPLLIGDATHQEVKLSITLPKGAKVKTQLAPHELQNQGRTVIVRDRVKDSKLVLDRMLDIPSGRVQPNEYPEFIQFARAADDALAADVRIELR